MIGNAYVEGLGAFSKVTKLVRDVWTQGPESHEKPQETAAEEDSSGNNYDTQNSLDNEFENLLPDVQVSAVILSVYLKDICNKKI